MSLARTAPTRKTQNANRYIYDLAPVDAGYWRVRVFAPDEHLWFEGYARLATSAVQLAIAHMQQVICPGWRRTR